MISRPMTGTRRFLWGQHVAAALVLVVSGLLITGFVTRDRAPPVSFEHGEIIPNEVRAGQRVVVRWTTHWNRQCEGELSREVSGPDNVVKAYRMRVLRVPVYLGRQTADTTFIVPIGMPPGPATYDGIIRFTDCGLTSRWHPIVVQVPQLSFTVLPPPPAR